MPVTGLREEKGWRRGGPRMEKKKKHKGQSVDSASSYNSLTFSMSTWFARTLCEIVLDECDFSDNISGVCCTYCISRWFTVVSYFFFLSCHFFFHNFACPHTEAINWKVFKKIYIYLYIYLTLSYVVKINIIVIFFQPLHTKCRKCLQFRFK